MPAVAQPGRASGCRGLQRLALSAYQAHRYRSVAGSNPARGIINVD